MPRRPVASPENDAQVADIVRLRMDEQLSFTEIALRVGTPDRPLSGNAASQKFYRWASSQGIKVEPFRGAGQAPYIRLGESLAHDDLPAPAPPGQPAGTPAATTQPGPQVAQSVTIKAERRAGWRQSILITADHHFDHVHCDRDLLRFHLDQARAAGAGILVLGDLFCAMQGKTDRRASKPDLRPEYLVDAYADAIVDDAAEWYAPYADLLWLISYGNHESKYQSFHETDLLKRLVKDLNKRPGAAILLGSYAGWLSFECTFDDDTPPQRLRLRYHHGWGGGGPVTLGTIGTNRQAAAADYDIYAQGHIHERWCVTRTRETVDADGRHVSRDVPHICAGTYKREGLSGQGWHIETGKPLKPSGGYWLHLYWSERSGCVLAKAEEVDQ